MRLAHDGHHSDSRSCPHRLSLELWCQLILMALRKSSNDVDYFRHSFHLILASNTRLQLGQVDLLTSVVGFDELANDLSDGSDGQLVLVCLRCTDTAISLITTWHI